MSGSLNVTLIPQMGERVLGSLQTVSDIMSSDIHRGREAGLPPYVEYRKYCHLPVPKKFEDLLEWMPAEVRLQDLVTKFE